MGDLRVIVTGEYHLGSLVQDCAVGKAQFRVWKKKND